jgi:hypothetical protein
LLPLLGGCSSILGLEEATCDEDVDPNCAGGGLEADDDQGDDDDGPPPVFTELPDLCAEYCETVTATCTADDGTSQYASAQACEAVCLRGMSLGSPGDKDSGLDTAYCRYENSLTAGDFGEIKFDCATAGLGGNGACGDICDVYCSLLVNVCGEVLAGEFILTDHETCVAECETVPRTPEPFDFEVDSGNTLECRLWHIQAAFNNAEQHCPHSAGALPCADP